MEEEFKAGFREDVEMGRVVKLGMLRLVVGRHGGSDTEVVDTEMSFSVCSVVASLKRDS